MPTWYSVQTADDRILIENLCTFKNYGTKRLIPEFPTKGWSVSREPTKTAHHQNGPNEGRKRPTQTKTALTKTAPM